MATCTSGLPTLKWARGGTAYHRRAQAGEGTIELLMEAGSDDQTFVKGVPTCCLRCTLNP